MLFKNTNYSLDTQVQHISLEGVVSDALARCMLLLNALEWS